MMLQMQAASHAIIHVNCSLVLHDFYQNCNVSTNLNILYRYQNDLKMG